MRSTARTARGPNRAPGRLVTPKVVRYANEGDVEPAEVFAGGRVKMERGADKTRNALIGLGPAIGTREDCLDGLPELWMV